MPPDPTILYETTPDAAPDTGGGDYPTEPVPDTPDAPEAPAPDYAAMMQSPEGQQYAQQYMEQYAQYAQPQEAYYEEPQEYEDPFANLDPLDPGYSSQFGSTLLDAMGQMIDQRFAQFQQDPGVQAMVNQGQSAWATDQFGRIEQELKAPLPDNHREVAIAMAAGAVPPDGDPNSAYFRPEAALMDASSRLHQLIQAERAAAVKEYQEGLTRPATGAAEPSASGMAAVHGEEPAQDMREVRLRWEREGRFG